VRNFKNLQKCSKNAENSVEQGDIGHTIPNKVKLSLKAKEKLQVRYTVTQRTVPMFGTF
jgi:hypothetical protein